MSATRLKVLAVSESKGFQMTNRFLEKISENRASGLAAFAQNFRKGWNRSSTTSKIGLGVSTIGLSTGLANYHHNVNVNVNRRRNEELSLQQLRAINRALKKPHEVVVSISPNSV